jgi:tetratricopeptide (TPR) repeat protein
MPAKAPTKPKTRAITPGSQLWQIPGVLIALLIFGVAAYIARHPIQEPGTLEADFAALKAAYEGTDSTAAVTSAERFLARHPSSDAEAFARFVFAYGKWDLGKSNPAARRSELSECLASFRKAELLGLAPAYEAKLLWAEGDVLLRLGMPTEAADSYLLLLEKYPFEKKALLQLAIAHSRQRPANNGKAKDAIDKYLAADGLTPEETLQGYLAQGELELASKNYAAATASAQRVLDANPSGETAAQAVLVANEALVAQEDYAGALAVLDKAPADGAGRFQAPLSLARAISLWKNGSATEARKAFDETVFAFPGTSEALSARFELASLFLQSNQIDAAKDALVNLLDDMAVEQAVETTHFTISDVTDLWFKVGQAILAQREYGAVRDFHSAATALMSQGHFMFFDAALYLREAEQLEALLPGLPPDKAEASRAKIRDCYHQAGVAFSKVLESASGDLYTKALYSAGHSFYMAGDYATAVPLLDEFAGAKLKDEHVPEVLYKEATALAALGSYERAINVCRGNAADHPTNIYAYRSMLLEGDLYRSLGGSNLAYAADIYSGILTDGRFLSESPEWRRAIYALGETLYKIGDFKNAMLRLDEALQRFPDDPEAGSALYYFALACRQAAFADPAGKQTLLMRAASVFARLAAGAADDESQTRNAAFLEADSYYDLGDYAKALSLYDKAVEAHLDTPEATRALFQMANCYHRMGLRQQADATYKRAVFNLQRRGHSPAPGDEFYKSLAAWRGEEEA